MYSYEVIIEDERTRLATTNPETGAYAEVQHEGELTDEACQTTLANFFIEFEKILNPETNNE